MLSRAVATLESHRRHAFFVSAIQNLSDCTDHVCHVAIRELRRKGQAHRLLSNAKAVRIILGPPAESFPVIRMDRDALIMHTNTDVFGCHIGDELVTGYIGSRMIYQYSIEMIGMPRPVFRLRGNSQ